jgi:hypothetical protein
MVALPELIVAASAVIAILMLAIHYRLVRLSDSGLFAYGLLMVIAIAFSMLAIILAPANHVARAVADVGILLTGALAFAASRWLLFAFRVAGDSGDH